MLKQHFSQVLFRLNALEKLHFFSMPIYVSELTVVSLCITSRKITPSLSQNALTIMFLAQGEHQGAALSLVFHPSLFLSRDLQCSYQMQHVHHHC
jgi:hypothetical protein